MMRKRFSRIIIVLLFVFLRGGMLQAASSRKVLILYDQGVDKSEPALTDARYLANLMGHFQVSCRLMNLAYYKPGTMDKNDVIFYINYEKKYSLPESFVQDFFNTQKTFCWMNNQLGQLDQKQLAGRFGFHFEQYREDLGFNRVIYKGTEFPKGDDNINIVRIDDPGLVTVVASVHNDRGLSAPYILKTRNLWFIADSPFSYYSENDRYIAFADVLHDILGEDHPVKHTALVRIEDVNPTTDPDSLWRIVKYLKGENIPFAVGLTPVFIDPVNKLEYHLEEMPELLAVLRKIPQMGGTFILHGYTHQYHGVTTDDYEFWDDIADKPVRGDSYDNAALRIEKGLRECFSNDIYPLVWETPHYFASDNAYHAIKKYFSLVYERRRVRNFLGTDQFFPYRVTDIFGQETIPENLGYVHLDKPDAQEIIDAARLNLSVRDCFASFFFHPIIDISYLRQIVKGVRKLGYVFGDIKEFSPEVRAKDKAIVSQTTDVSVLSNDKYLAIKTFNLQGQEVSQQILVNTAGQQNTVPVKCGPGEYVVVKPQENLEPGFWKKMWHLAKTDLSYLRRISAKKSGGKLNEVMDVAFIDPPVPPVSREENNDLKSLKFSLSVAGIKFQDLNSKDILNLDLRDYDLIILPYAAAKNLKAEEIKHLLEAISSGADLVTDGATKVGDALGIELQEESILVKQIRDNQFPDLPLYWSKTAGVKPIYKSADKDYQIISAEESSNLPVAVGGRLGKGGFLYYATYFDPDSDRGYSRFPFLAETLTSVFNYPLLAERKAAEMYFDPGMRQFISIEKLAVLWRKYGVQKIYAGGWHFYSKYSYDYARLLKVCHQNGILVYCWLEPPMVNQRFWDQHPEWREKTAKLKDGKVSWRNLMNLADEHCRQKAFSEISALLTRYDWDGVNLSELYFESAGGPAYPENFTPMNETVRKEFTGIYGFDPLQIFDPQSAHYWQNHPEDWGKLARYRRDLSFRLKTYYLDMLSGIQQKKKDFEIVMTAIDTSQAPQLEDYLGESTDNLISLQKKYDLTLQVEDSLPFWSGKPDRYLTLGNYYRKFIKADDQLALDCNILDNHKKGEGGLPAEKPTGEEIRQIAYNMDLTKSRPVFYSEATIYENDYRNISSVLARDVNIKAESDTQWKINTPYMVTIRSGRQGLITKLDDDNWFAGEGEEVVVPAGEHTLKFEAEPRYFDMASMKPRLSYISGELKWANFSNNAIEFSYSAERSACYAIINKIPARIYVDDNRANCQIYEGDTGYSVRLPRGTHVVKIVVAGGLARLVETSGVVLFSLIFIFGFFTSVTFIALFLAIQIKRKWWP